MTDKDLARARQYSLWLARQADNGLLDETWLLPRLARPLDADDFSGFADWQSPDESDLARSLRRLRRHVLAQVMVRDLGGAADLDEVCGTVTRLADFAVNAAERFAHAALAARYGEPYGHFSRAPQRLSVVAMGKAGGFELNVSSDIDLIFIYPENGETDGKRRIGNQEFFTKVGKKIIALLDDVTEDGQVFRVDMRLRPDGDSGALVCSEAALEQYLATQGREWERYAWCKARVVTPHANGLRDLVRPFVFRKYLDYNAYEAMRDLHRQIAAEAHKRGAENNIKIGTGGIREVEFVAQIFQMIRGGQNRALQLKGTRETLNCLAEHGILPEQTVAELSAAYRFLRDTEHRLQYWDDAQTQILPDAPVQRAALARSMGFADDEAFAQALDDHRQRVHAVFAEILDTPERRDDAAHALDGLWRGADDDGADTAAALRQAGYADVDDLAGRLRRLKAGSRYRRLSTHAQPRFDAVVPRLLEAAARCPQPERTAARLLDFLEAVSRRSAYLAFLRQYPAALAQLAQLMSQSAWLADYLQRHPILLDELLSAQLMAPLDWTALANELARQLAACEDTESMMDTLRHFQHAQTFRLAVQDLAGLYSVERISDELSQLADTVLAAALPEVWRRIAKIHRPDPQFAVIGYGKLGGKELGYASDLDLVYLYDDPHPEAAENYAKLARRLNTCLSGSTGAGTLYELDLRLRPNGESGFLVHSTAAFARYQRENAWTWEHQALSRARFVCGAADVAAQFDALRSEILTQNRDQTKLKQDIAQMRDKIAATHPPHYHDIKYARGGIIDVEFIVQYGILAHARAHPELLDNKGNIALLARMAQNGVLPAQSARAAAEAYRRYRQRQHAASLHDHAAIVVDDDLRRDYAAVCQLWAQVFDKK
nr:bifunctional [glutamate--ammonia ligase]-adenylyl-L-tyrosine phosphorylase/[glutamate--ammonia-ligase] adenylyltransferase [Conchiformibius kuhniae]